jgi:hypothetical protein
MRKLARVAVGQLPPEGTRLSASENLPQARPHLAHQAVQLAPRFGAFPTVQTVPLSAVSWPRWRSGRCPVKPAHLPAAHRRAWQGLPVRFDVAEQRWA